MFGNYPTPMVPLRRLSEVLGGPQIWIKRDDLTGLALGGNKTRKIEHLIRDAIAKKADVVLTAGAQQSNHCRQTAAACAVAGLECHLVLGGTKPQIPSGNLLLDHLLKATIHYAGAERKGESLTRLAERLEREGRTPCIIPYGGSNAIGARGFVDAAEELSAQVQERKIELNRIIFPSSSGGTHAGLMVGSRLHGLSAQIIGVAIDKGEAGDKPFDQHITDIANETSTFYSLAKDFSVSDVNLAKGYLGGGYGVVGDMEREAIEMLASLEGVLLDPVYTGRAMGGLIDMIRRREIDSGETVLFWHTGGAPALFSYAADLVA